MRKLLKSVTVIDPQGQFHNQVVDILIDQGMIQDIAPTIRDEKAKKIKIADAHVSFGWFDPSVSLGEPGFEERETLINGVSVAAKSGYTAIGIQPNTDPVIQSKAAINFVKSHENVVTLHPIGALTVDSKGQDLCELFDMFNVGAVAFGDFKKGIKDPNILRLALEYVQSFSGLVCSFPLDSALGNEGMMHEGGQSVQLGLKGIPKLAEHLQISRDLSILKYTGGKLHIPTISTAESVALIRQAKKEGLKVSSSVSVYNLVLTDQVLGSFETDYKLLPPLRGQDDQKALIQGLNDGTIDGVTSDHNPIDIEHKNVEFDHAMFGSVGLEHTFGVLLEHLSLDQVINALTGLRTSFGLEKEVLAPGNKANMTLFTIETTGVVDKEELSSKSKNTALNGLNTKGKVLGIINQDKEYWHE